MSLTVERAKAKVGQRQGCILCKNGRHDLCARLTKTGFCCCGQGNPTLQTTFKGTVKEEKIKEPKIH